MKKNISNAVDKSESASSKPLDFIYSVMEKFVSIDSDGFMHVKNILITEVNGHTLIESRERAHALYRFLNQEPVERKLQRYNLQIFDVKLYEYHFAMQVLIVNSANEHETTRLLDDQKNISPLWNKKEMEILAEDYTDLDWKNIAGHFPTNPN